MVRLLLDLAHEPLLRDSASVEGLDTWKRFKNEWCAILGCEPELLMTSLDELPRVREVGSTVLVLAAPTLDLTASEIESALTFIRSGGGLLLAYNNKSLQTLQTDCLEILGERLGFKPKMYRQVPPQKVKPAYVHYTIAGISEFAVGQPAAFEVLDDELIPVIDLDETDKIVGCAQVGRGRVLISADISWLADRSWGWADNAQFARNVIRWLTFTNSVDCRVIQAPREAVLGKPIVFSLILSNPHNTSLGRMRCELESNCGADITPSVEIVRFLPAGGQTWVQWSVLPNALGKHELRLRVILRHKSQRYTLMFPRAASFNVLANADLNLRFDQEPARDVTSVMVNQPFVAVGQANWQSGETRAPVTLELRFPRTAFHLEKEEPQDDTLQRWHLVGRKVGDYTLTLRLSQTGQKVQRRIQVLGGLRQYLHRACELVPRVEAEIRPVLRRIREEFLSSEVANIAFNVLTPQEYVKLVFSPVIAEQLLEAIEVARQERQPNIDLMLLLARNIVPMFSPRTGACVPFDPGLAKRMGNWDVRYRDDLEANFLALDFADEVTLTQNLAAYLLHEKYGHGFFYTHTRVGQQLAILSRHRFLNGLEVLYLPRPYPAEQQKHYATAIEALNDSVMLVDEGFAAWVELTVLRKIPGILGQSHFRRRTILLEKASQLREAKKREYLRAFPPADERTESPYREVYRRLEALAERMGPDYGEKCAVQAVVRAADINLGITESNGTVLFGLTPRQMEDALLNPEEGDDARCDRRFRRIFRVLIEELQDLQDEQHRLECYRTCWQPECPVDRLIRRKLGW